jgi:hypothetical protein
MDEPKRVFRVVRSYLRWSLGPFLCEILSNLQPAKALAYRWDPSREADELKRTELPQTTMSRHLLDLGDRNGKKERGLGLITSRFNRFDHCKRDYILTETGARMA